MTSESTEELAEAEAALEAEGGGPQVGIIVGADSDLPVMGEAGVVLDELGVSWEIGVMSAHREPESVVAYCSGARARGIKVIIAGAGLSAALPGMAAAQTDLPVIGVPLSSPSGAAGGLDSILSVVQMPGGVPVASVGLDNAANAGHLAARILFS